MTERLERLINLVIALRETRRPMPATEVRERVAGYGQPDAEAFRRMFERDKADLRDLGVPIETAPLDRWDDRQGYRIDPRRYDLPPVRLEPDELGALAVAVQATGMVDEAGAGLLKLRVDAGDPAPGPAAPDPRLGIALDTPHRDVLVTAQLRRTSVRFAYQRAGEQRAGGERESQHRAPGERRAGGNARDRDPAVRTVDPHALVHRRGRWYLVGRDHDRDERRAFRLDRIQGKVRTIGLPGSFVAPDDDVSVDDVVPGRRGDAPATAEVLASAEVAWQVARRARGGGAATDDGWTRFTVSAGDPDDFMFWALEFGPELEVVGPPELRAAVVARLRGLMEDAGEGSA